MTLLVAPFFYFHLNWEILPSPFQVSQTIHISWVKPRVLDRKQLGTLVSKIDEWTTSIAQMENLIQANASDILTA